MFFLTCCSFLLTGDWAFLLPALTVVLAVMVVTFFWYYVGFSRS